MALGRKSNVVADETNNISSLDEKREPHRDPAIETGVYGYDVEKTQERGRKMSRLGGPTTIGIADSDEDSVVSVGKQMEMEASNSIKYRTCSWQKVTSFPFSLRFLVKPDCSISLRTLKITASLEFAIASTFSLQW